MTNQISSNVLQSITTPDSVETPIGTLEFFDGVPTHETSQKIYDNLDRMRGVEVFLNCMPGASIYAMRQGYRSLGAQKSHQVVIADRLLDSKPLYLTGNTSTLYAAAFLDLKNDGPIVMEIPLGMLGAFNDMWFRWVQDVGPFGPDKGQGGNDAAVKNIENNLRIYPLVEKNNPPKTELISLTSKEHNTIHPNNYTFYEHINELVQEESMEMLDSETRGLLASIGIVKGQPFNPDARMKQLLTEAVAIGNATARAIVWYPRIDGAKIYPDTDSAWVMAYAGKDVFFEKEGTRNLDARVMFHYPYTGISPAMAVSIPGKGSDYGMAYLDSNKQAMDGSKAYKLHLPPKVPVNDFWAVTVYDTQTRSMLQTEQLFPTIGSNNEGIEQNADGSYDVYFGPKPPEGKENNWLETIPGKSWFAILRMYGPLEAWINKTWRPGEIELIK